MDIPLSYSLSYVTNQILSFPSVVVQFVWKNVGKTWINRLFTPNHQQAIGDKKVFEIALKGKYPINHQRKKGIYKGH